MSLWRWLKNAFRRDNKDPNWQPSVSVRPARPGGTARHVTRRASTSAGVAAVDGDGIVDVATDLALSMASLTHMSPQNETEETQQETPPENNVPEAPSHYDGPLEAPDPSPSYESSPSYDSGSSSSSYDGGSSSYDSGSSSDCGSSSCGCD